MGTPWYARFLRLPSRSATHVARDVDDELSFHLDMKTHELSAERGLPDSVARARATAEFGDLEYTRRALRHEGHRLEHRRRRATLLDEIAQDVRYALRQLRRSPVYAAIAVVTLALGIGANTAIFTVVRGMLLRALPYPDADRLVRVYSASRGRRTSSSPRDFLDWRAETRTFGALAASFESTTNLTGSGDPVRLSQARVSANYFDILAARPILGRTFAAGEDEISSPRVAVIGERLWRSRFGADPQIIGRAITLDGSPTEIIGVLPASVRYPQAVDLWLTTRFDERDIAESSRGARWIQVIGRLAPRATLDAAQREMTEIARRIEVADPRHNTGYTTQLTSLLDSLVGSIRQPLYVLFGAVAFVMLIACANVASLALGRAAARDGELALRTALGAGRWRLARQLLVEHLCVSILGAAGGVLLAVVGTRALVAFAPGSFPRLEDVRVDGFVLLFALAAAVITGLLFGLIPALHGSTAGLSLRLRDGTRGGGSRAGGPVGRSRARGTLVVAELALAIVLLTGAGLMLRSFARLRAVDPGFRTAQVSTFTVTLSPVTYPRLDQQRAFAHALLERIEQIPGVRSAAATFNLPLAPWSFGLTFDVRGRPPAPNGNEPRAEVRVATADYFATMGIPLVRGRLFTPEDRAGGPPVIVISQEVARRAFPNEDPIGKYIETGWQREGQHFGGTIIGIVGDIRQSTLRSDPAPHAYMSLDQWPLDELTIVMRASVPADVVLSSARAVVRALDADTPVYDATTLDAMVADSLGESRFFMTLLGAFAAVALVLASVGIYGVIAYAVQQRTREIGIRIALGATERRVLMMVVGRGVALTATGIILGLAGAFALTRLIAAMLYGVKANDGPTFAAVAALLAAVAIVASWIPARRAARVDPIVAIRSD